MTHWPSRSVPTYPPLGLPVSCLVCAGRVEVVNATSNGTLSVAILGCQECSVEWELSMRLIPHRLPGQVRSSDYRRKQRERSGV